MKHFPGLISGALVALSSGIAISAHADQPKTIIAIFSQKDSVFSETIILYANGKYQQSETQKRTELYRPYSVHGPCFPNPAPPYSLQNPKREGTWRILDKAGGLPVAIKMGDGFPENMVVELKGAMPFGMTWDNVLPYTSHGDRVLPTASFQAAPPAPLEH